MNAGLLISSCFPLALALVGMSLQASMGAPAPESYQNYDQMSRDLKRAANRHAEVLRLHPLGESSEGRQIWLAELGSGAAEDRKSRPALLVVAGLEGNDVTGSASVAHWVADLAGKFAEDDAVNSLLQRITIYALPRLNPDALESYFARPRRESLTDPTQVDEDHDGLIDEDGGDDLNQDGMISWMRVEDPMGEYVLDSTDPRILIKADPLKGEHGQWRLLPEGIDDDQDEAWNEDGPGGVNFNRNFPFHYQYFDPQAGRHPVSQIETRALADFVVDHPNIAVSFAFGSTDNLAKTPKGESSAKRPPQAMQEKDVDYLRELGKQWRKSLGLSAEWEGGSASGTFSDWMYYHRGRLSLAAQAWSPALALELSKSREKDKEASATEDKDSTDTANDRQSTSGEAKSDPALGKDKADSPEPDKRSEDDRRLLSWMLQQSPEAFLPWETFVHPDFPDHRVQIGGWAPFARSVAPISQLTNLLSRHAAFFTELAGRLPRVEIRKVEVKNLGKSIFDITAHVANGGYLPTALAQGETTREVFPTRVMLEVDDTQVLGGTKRVMLSTLAGSGGVEEVRWVCRIPEADEVELTVISMLGGMLHHTIVLKGQP